MRVVRQPYHHLDAAVLSLLCLACTPEAAPHMPSVSLDTVVTLGFDTLDAPQWGATVAFQPETGLVVVSPSSGAGELYLFGADGQLVRKFGRRGKGPEELIQVEGLLFADSIYVLDPGNRRISMYSPAGVFARSVTVEGLDRVAARTPGKSLIVRTPNVNVGDVAAIRLGSGDPEAYLFRDSAAHSFGDEEPYAHFAAAASGGLWVAGLRKYQIRRFSDAGVEAASYTYSPDWFNIVPRNAEKYADWVDSRSVVDGLSEDINGLLWVKLGVPEAVYPDTAVNFETLDRATIDLFSDEVIEAIDPHTGAVVAHRRFPFSAITLLPGGYAWLLSELPGGEPQIVVVRLRVNGYQARSD